MSALDKLLTARYNNELKQKNVSDKKTLEALQTEWTRLNSVIQILSRKKK